MSANEWWTEAEVARVDKCLELRIGPMTAMPYFPGRTNQAIHTKFAHRRRAIGAVGRNRRPSSNLSSALRALERFCAEPVKPVAFIVSTELVPPPKVDTTDTPEARSSRALLRRQLETGLHWINCPERYAAACRSAGLPNAMAA